MNAKTTGGIAVAVTALVAYLAVFRGVKLPFTGDPVERQIEKFAGDMNERLPMQVNEVTRWDRVEPGPGKAYSCVYTISKNLTSQERQVVRETVTRQVLKAPETQATFAAGITVWYKYYDPSGRKLLEFPVRK